MTADSTSEGEIYAKQQPGQPVDLVATQVMPDSNEGVVPQIQMVPIDPIGGTSAPTLAAKVAVPLGFLQQPGAPNPSPVPTVPFSVDPYQGDLQAQALAIAQAGGDPLTGSFSSVMAGLREACGLMTEGFQCVSGCRSSGTEDDRRCHGS